MANKAKMWKKERKKDYLDEHVLYEFSMLLHGLEWLQGSERDDFLRNAVYESVAMHTRVLIEFLFAVRQEDAHVYSSLYGDRPRDRAKTVQDLWIQAGQQIAHLTYNRPKVETEKQKWLADAILATLEEAIGEFCECAESQSDRKGDWRDLKNRAKELKNRAKQLQLRVDGWPDNPHQPCTTTSLSSPFVGGESFRRTREKATDTASGAAGDPAGAHGGSEQ